MSRNAAVSCVNSWIALRSTSSQVPGHECSIPHGHSNHSWHIWKRWNWPQYLMGLEPCWSNAMDSFLGTPGTEAGMFFPRTALSLHDQPFNLHPRIKIIRILNLPHFSLLHWTCKRPRESQFVAGRRTTHSTILAWQISQQDSKRSEFPLSM